MMVLWQSLMIQILKLKMSQMMMTMSFLQKAQSNFVKLPLTAATRAVARSAGEVDSYASPSIPAHWAAASSTLPKSTAAR